MPLLKINTFVVAGGEKRRFLAIQENSKGDTYVTIRAGFQVGLDPNAVPVKELRISLHPSLNSPDVTSIKFATATADGQNKLAYSATRVVKLYPGYFTPLYICRLPYFKDTYHGLSESKFKKSGYIDFGDFDQSIETVSVSIILGGLGAPYPFDNAAIVSSKNFQIILLLHKAQGLNAIEHSQAISILAPPKDPSLSPEEQAATLNFFTAFTANEACEMLNYMHAALTVHQVDTILFDLSSVDKDEHKIIFDHLDYVRQTSSHTMQEITPRLRFPLPIDFLTDGTFLPAKEDDLRMQSRNSNATCSTDCIGGGVEASARPEEL